MMGHMAPDSPTHAASPAQTSESVVEFGGAPEPATGRRRRFSLTELAGGLAADRRSVPVAAVVGAVALFASLISEWQITVVNSSDFSERRGAGQPLAAGVADLGALGGGYIAGLFVLAGAVVLVLFGPPQGRRYARLLGLTAGGMVAALLVALVQTLSAESRARNVIVMFDITAEQMELTYGRGLWCGFVGVAAVALALWLAGRHLAAAPPVAAAAADDDEDTDGPAPAPEVWSWRRPQRSAPEDAGVEAPMDLTVTSTTPFTSRNEDLDAPAKRDETP